MVQNRCLNQEWIKALASLKDPTTYDAMIQYLVTNPYNRYGTYQAIKNLPGIKIDDKVIREIWKNIPASQENDHQKSTFAIVALGVGELDALDIVNVEQVLEGNVANILQRQGQCNNSIFKRIIHPLEVGIFFF